jgi:MFS family permease
MTNDAPPSPSTTATGWRRPIDSLSIPQFRLLFLSAFCSHAGIQMTSLARPWLAFELTDSALMLGLVAAAQGVPQLIVSPLGGVAADRLPKRTVLHVSTALLTAIALVTAALIFFDVIRIWHLIVLAVVFGTVLPFNQPARHAFVPVVVPRAKLGNALGLFAAVRNMNQVLGPSIAGILIGVDPFLAYAAIAIAQVLAFILAMGLPKAAPVDPVKRSVTADLVFGLRYIWDKPILRSLVVINLIVIGLGLPYQQVLPVFQKDVLGVGPEMLGLMFAALGLGALVASMLVATFPGMIHRGYPMLAMAVAFGGALVAFALSPVFALSVVLLFVTGFTSQAFGTLNSTLMMFNTEPQFYGRISSVNMMSRSLTPLVVLPFGALIDSFGAGAVVAVSGAALMVAILLYSAIRPDLLRSSPTGNEPSGLS